MTSSIGIKLWICFLATLVVLIVVGTASYNSITRLVADSHQVAHVHQTMQKLADVTGNLRDAETGQRGYVITGEDRYLQPYTSALRNIDGHFRELSDDLGEDSAQRRRLDTLRGLIAEKLGELRETIDLRRDKGFDAARAVVLTDRGKQTMDDFRTMAGEMENDEYAVLERRQQETEQSARNALMTIVVGIIGTCALVIVAAIYLTRHICSPLREVTHVAESITYGDLSVDVRPTSRSDEVGSLSKMVARMTLSLREMAEAARQIAAGDLSTNIKPQSEKDVLGSAFAAMIVNLRNIMSELREGIAVLSSAASEILAATAQSAASSAQTATAVSETTTTVEEVKRTAQLSTEKARQVSDTAQRAAQTSVSGKKSVLEALEAIQRIQSQMQTIGEGIGRLSEQGHAIAEITATVNDLAEQSNLLAVNAAIEAAKAGEQGKGFAVVAAEVKSLAEQSKQATAQVRVILGDIQKATSAAVMATEQGNRAVESGVRLSGEAGESIRVLSDSIMESSQAAIQIAASAQQQLVGVDQVAIAMRNIGEASTQSVDSTRQVEAAARNLHELGQRLSRVAERYRI